MSEIRPKMYMSLHVRVPSCACPFMCVSLHVRVPSRACPFMYVSLHVRVPSRACPFTCVSLHVRVPSRACPFLCVSLVVAVSVVKLQNSTVKLHSCRLLFEQPGCEFSLKRDGQINCSFLICKAIVTDENRT